MDELFLLICKNFPMKNHRTKLWKEFYFKTCLKTHFQVEWNIAKMSESDIE